MTAATARASLKAPATGLIAQVLLLDLLAVTAGLSVAGWIVGAACALIMATALARGLGRGRWGPASWVTLTRATLAVGVAALAADSFTRDTPVALLVTLAAVALALDAADGWVAQTHRDGDGAGRALRRRGRRVPDPRPQRLRRPERRRVGARDRRGALPVPGRRVAAAVDARAAPAPPLAAGGRRGAGDRADGRGRRRPAARAHAGPPARRARGADARRWASARGGCGAAGKPRACRRASPSRSRSSPCCSSGPRS